MITQHLEPRGRAMTRQYRSIDVEKVGDVFLVRFRNSSLDEFWVQQLGEELRVLIEVEACRKLIISFADCEALYSVLLGKLMTVRRQLEAVNGRLKLTDVSPLVRDVFRTCKLDQYFEFAPDREQAMAEW